MSSPKRFEPSNAEPFVQLPVACRCGKREPRRVARWKLEALRLADPERVAETVQCSCGRTNGIKAKAYQQALAEMDAA